MDIAFPKNVLNIDAMMTQFLTDEPKQLLDMLEVACDYIPLELEKFNRAIDAKDTATLKAILHSLKGGVAYISAPDSSAVIAKWDEHVREGQVKDDDFSVMKKK